MGMLMQMRRGSYVNKDAVENCVRYITRTRANEYRGNELIAWGGAGVGYYDLPEFVIQQFSGVQKTYGIEGRGGRRLYHETFNLTDAEFEQLGRNYDLVNQIAIKCAEFYYLMGHQVVFAVHHARSNQKGNRGVHIHFVVNAVNFMTGEKWHTGMRQSFMREQKFNQIMRDVIEEKFNPLEFMLPG